MMTRRDLGTHSHHNSPNREKKIPFLQLGVGFSLELSAHLMSTKGNGASCCFHPVLAGSLKPEQMRQNWRPPKYSLCPRSVSTEVLGEVGARPPHHQHQGVEGARSCPQLSAWPGGSHRGLEMCNRPRLESRTSTSPGLGLPACEMGISTARICLSGLALLCWPGGQVGGLAPSRALAEVSHEGGIHSWDWLWLPEGNASTQQP